MRTLNAARYRAEHIGSLLRPPELLQARTQYARGELSREQLRAQEDQAILGVIAMQRDIGLDVISDGEYRRAGWFYGFYGAVDGFTVQPVTRERRGPEGTVTVQGTIPVITGKLKAKKRITEEEASFLSAHARVPFKITLPSPVVVLTSSYVDGQSDAVYPTHADAARDLVEIMRGELTALVDDGVPYVQIDAPAYTQLNDPSQRERLIETGWVPERVIEEAIQADAACLAGLRGPGRTIAVHVCRGNVGGLWISDGSYDAIAERLFTTLDVDRLLLEYDTERAGTFAPLRFVPKDRIVVLGLVTTKSGELESRDWLLRRIEEAAQYIPVENLALSPQCGFATQAAGNPLTMDEERRKLELIVDVARAVWPDA